MKKIISLLLAAVLAFSLFSVAAFAEEEKSEEEPEEKHYDYKSEEVIYGVLDSDGKINKIIPVVVLDAEKETTARYYGSFTKIKNLTNTDELESKKDMLEIRIPKGRFYFETELKKAQVPWLVDISYKLDGKDISPEKLGGRSGQLEIIISIKANEKADKSFFDAYLMQISATLSSEKCKNIKAEGATQANAGANKMINFMSMPGTESEFHITADVTDFAMGGMSIAAVPLSMADMLGSMDGIAEGIDEFTSSMDQLSSGVSMLNNGAWQLSSGMAQFSDGLLTLSANSAPIRDTAEMILEGLRCIESVLDAIGGGDVDMGQVDLGILPESLRMLADSINATAGSIEAEQNNISAAIDNMYSAFYADRSGIDENGLIYINGLEAAWEYSAGILYTEISNLESARQEISCAAAAVSAAADNLEALINAGGGSSVDISESLRQFKELIQGFEMFYEGIIQYTEGVDMLADNSIPLTDGVYELAGGTSQLDAGTSQIPGKMDEMMEEMGGEDFEAHSFIDERNDMVSSVQFVFSTEAISAPDEIQEEDEGADRESGVKLFFSKLRALFETDGDK